MRSFRSFIAEGKRKQQRNGLTVMTLQDFVTESFLDELEDERDELTEAERFLGVSKRPLPPSELKPYIERIQARKKGKTEKYHLPYIHRSNVTITDESGKEFDLDMLRKQVTQRPTYLLKQNEKMKHSDGSATQYYNLGLPALKGLAVDESTGEFVVVDTCPGAGACKTFCFAMKGGYVQFAPASMSQTRVLNFLLNDPDGFEAMLSKEIAAAQKKIKDDKIKLAVRWHDSGDFFSQQYMNVAYDIARKFPTVDFYAYTKMAAVAKATTKPDNFIMNFSAGAQPSEEKQIDFTDTKHSRVVPKELFKDLMTRTIDDVPVGLIQIDKKPAAAGKKPRKTKQQKQQEQEDRALKFKSPQAEATFRQRLADHYKIHRDSILSYQEMMAIPKGAVPKWNVFVVPNVDGDDSANRRDVLGTYLLIH